jgi:hypothetical protein
VPETDNPAYFKATYTRRQRSKPAFSPTPSYSASCSSSSGEESEDEIAIPSCMSSGTKQSELPTVPPPHQYWRLKKLDHSASVMDYWIKSTQQWDIDGIESDIAVSLAN